MKLKDLSDAISRLGEQYEHLQTEYNLLSASYEEKSLLKIQHTFYEFGDEASKLLAFQARQSNNLKIITLIRDPSGSLLYSLLILTIALLSFSYFIYFKVSISRFLFLQKWI